MATTAKPETRDEATRPQNQSKKPLSAADLTTGLMYERNIATARARLEMAEEAQSTFLYHLRVSYDAQEDEWTITNWAEGFVRAQK